MAKVNVGRPNLIPGKRLHISNNAKQLLATIAPRIVAVDGSLLTLVYRLFYLVENDLHRMVLLDLPVLRASIHTMCYSKLHAEFTLILNVLGKACCVCGQCEPVETPFELIDSVRSKIKDGNTALHVATEHKLFDCMDNLLERSKKARNVY